MVTNHLYIKSSQGVKWYTVGRKSFQIQNCNLSIPWHNAINAKNSHKKMSVKQRTPCMPNADYKTRFSAWIYRILFSSKLFRSWTITSLSSRCGPVALKAESRKSLSPKYANTLSILSSDFSLRCRTTSCFSNLHATDRVPMRKAPSYVNSTYNYSCYDNALTYYMLTAWYVTRNHNRNVKINTKCLTDYFVCLLVMQLSISCRTTSHKTMKINKYC